MFQVSLEKSTSLKTIQEKDQAHLQMRDFFLFLTMSKINN
jgi:hypothetical protein